MSNDPEPNSGRTASDRLSRFVWQPGDLERRPGNWHVTYRTEGGGVMLVQTMDALIQYLMQSGGEHDLQGALEDFLRTHPEATSMPAKIRAELLAAGVISDPTPWEAYAAGS